MFEGKPRIVFKIEEPPPMGLVGWSDGQLFSRPYHWLHGRNVGEYSIYPIKKK
jgi:hypothetical protein